MLLQFHTFKLKKVLVNLPYSFSDFPKQEIDPVETSEVEDHLSFTEEITMSGTSGKKKNLIILYYKFT